MEINRRNFIKTTLGGLFLPLADSSNAAPTGLQYIVTNAFGAPLLRSLSEEKRHPASLTKMMTLYCVMDAMKNGKTDFDLDTPVTIPESIDLIGDDVAVFENLKPGEKYSAGKLMIGAGSKSDAYSTLALAIHLGSPSVYDWGGTENSKLHRFIELMNDTAGDLGMKDSRFSVCTGLPYANHYSTPRDIATLMRAQWVNFPKSCALAMGQAEFDIKPLSDAHTHSSKFLRAHDGEVLFAKTGFTNAAGHCLATAMKIKGEIYTSVIFGADSDSHRDKVMEFISAQLHQRTVKIPVPDINPNG